MTLQSSGAISLDNIATEFGGSQPHSLSEYYSGGGLVPSNTGSVPTSGAISMSQFYGTTAIAVGQVAYTFPGTYYWVCPSGISSVSVVCVGGGMSGWGNGNGGGDGGALGYKNSIPVTPGVTYKVVVGDAGYYNTGLDDVGVGGNSTFGIMNEGTYYQVYIGAYGGGAAYPVVPFATNYYGTEVGMGSDPSIGGGKGGTGGYTNYSYGAGGGGAGGYSNLDYGNTYWSWIVATGGTGGDPSGQAGMPGQGYGGGGGGGSGGAGNVGAQGGGVGILGRGSDGVPGSFSSPGTAGSGGSGILYGGGGGGSVSGGSAPTPTSGGWGAVRIIWPGSTRLFPTTNTGNL